MYLKDIDTTSPPHMQRIQREYNHTENSRRGINFQKLTHGTNKIVCWTCEKCGGTTSKQYSI